MADRWRCRACGGEFAQPARRWDWDDGAVATVTELCPRCGERQPERLERCPTCDGGWRRRTEPVCPKCHLRDLGELQRFARRFAPAALADLDDMLEGSALEMFT